VVVASTPTRRQEATQVAEGLLPGPFTIRLEVASGDPVDRFRGPGPWGPVGTGPFTLKDRPVVVSLPDLPLDIPGLGRLVISVPGQPWVVSLSSTRSVEPSPEPAALWRRPGDRSRTAVPFPVPGSRTILAAVMDPSWARKSRALLGANVAAAGATVLPFAPAALPPTAAVLYPFPTPYASEMPSASMD
jgi:hypothetical protein